jgi:hypothetical protein
MQNVGKLGLAVSNEVVQTKHGQNRDVVSIIYLCSNKFLSFPLKKQSLLILREFRIISGCA